MTPRLKVLLILCAAVAIASAASHVAIRWLKINVEYSGYHHYGRKDQKALTILHGSSLAYDGLDWDQISKAIGGAIESWATPGSSPTEWEIQHRRSPAVTCAFIVVSPYDLNEHFLCDFRADIVPLGQTIRDLRHCGADRLLSKDVLSQYPLMAVRKLFPTSGRSDGVMTGIRAEVQKLAGGSSSIDASDAPKFGSTGKSEVKEKLSDWSSARLQRRLVLLRAACQGKHSYDGLKKLALTRLLQQAGQQGQVLLVVMPVSPIYRKEFLSPRVMREFEMELSELRQRNPQVRPVRLDRLPVLEDNNMFSDLVHLNVYGQQIATAALLSEL